LGIEFKLRYKASTKRPFLLYLLPILFGLAGVIALIGTLGIFQGWYWWLYLAPLTSIGFQVFMGVLNTLLWFSAAVILWLRLYWAIMYGCFVTILLTVWHWIDLILLTRNPLPFSRHVLTLAITCLFLLFVFSALYLVAPSMQPFQLNGEIGGSTLAQPTGDKNE
jgi:hypothetical protein